MAETKKMCSKEAIIKEVDRIFMLNKTNMDSPNISESFPASVMILSNNLRYLIEVLVDIRDVLDELKEIERAKALQAIKR